MGRGPSFPWRALPMTPIGDLFRAKCWGNHSRTEGSGRERGRCLNPNIRTGLPCGDTLSESPAQRAAGDREAVPKSRWPCVIHRSPLPPPGAGCLQCQRASQPGSGEAAPTAKTTAVPTAGPRAGTQGPGPSADTAHFPPTPPRQGDIAASFYQRGKQAGRAVDGIGHTGIGVFLLPSSAGHPLTHITPHPQTARAARSSPPASWKLRQPGLCQGELLGKWAFFWQQSAGSRPSHPEDRFCSFPEPPL